MFKFLKEKLKEAISKITKKADEEADKEIGGKAESKEEEIKQLEKEKKELEEKEKKINEELKKEKEKKAAAEKKRKEEEKTAEEKKKAEAKKEEERKAADEEKKKAEGKKAEDAKQLEKGKKEIEEKEKKEAEEKKREEEEEAKKKKEAEARIKELEEKKEEIKKEEKEIEQEEKAVEKEKKGFFAKLKEKITKTTISAGNFEKLFWDLEVVLLENNVAVEVIEKIKEDLKQNLVDKPIPRGKVDETIVSSLKNSISEVISTKTVDIVDEIKGKKEKPYVLCFIGVNGSGKTTSIAKITKFLQDNGFSCVMAAADTFRAAAIDQLQIHADNLNVKLIKHDYGSDAAAVAFDAIKHAQAKKIDAVLIDTAGRMHSNANLMDEMKKIVRVANPDMNIFVGESITGNDCTEQAKKFNDAVGIDAIILSKVDVDEKGGAAISIGYVTKKPIIFIGTGQEYKDLEQFRPEKVLESLGL